MKCDGTVRKMKIRYDRKCSQWDQEVKCHLRKRSKSRFIGKLNNAILEIHYTISGMKKLREKNPKTVTKLIVTKIRLFK